MRTHTHTHKTYWESMNGQILSIFLQGIVQRDSLRIFEYAGER